MVTERRHWLRRLWLTRWRFHYVWTAVIAGTIVVLGGTLGFWLIEDGWTLFDAFYMTVITISTVGFSETYPLSPAGRVFAVLLILGGGVATLSFVLRSLFEIVMEAPRRRVRARMRRMKGHILICGYGRVSIPLVEGLERMGSNFCVIERSPAKVQALLDAGRIAVEGDATTDEVLATAGVRRATMIAALLPSDGDNLSIAMTAAAMRPGIRVVARAEEERSRANLVRAGAAPHDVVSPYATAGRRLLRNVSSPRIARVMRGIQQITDSGFSAGRFLVKRRGEFAGRTLAELDLGATRGVTVMAVLHRGGDLRLAPTGSYRVLAGDELVLTGDPDSLQAIGATLDG